MWRVTRIPSRTSHGKRRLLPKVSLHQTGPFSSLRTIPAFINPDEKLLPTSRPTASSHRPTSLIFSNSILSYSFAFEHKVTPHSCQSVRRKSVFVSKHNQSLQITPRDILDYCQSHGISTEAARTTSTHVILRECPFCSKPTGGKPDNCYKCYIQIGGGAYFCHRCGSNGSWYDLKMKLSGFQMGGPSEGKPSSSSNNLFINVKAHNSSGPRAGRTFQDFMDEHQPSPQPISCLPMPPPRLQACYSSQLLDQNKPNTCLEYLHKVRGLTSKTLRKYGVGQAKYDFMNQDGKWEPTECVTFPWLMSVAAVEYQEELRGAKFRWEQDRPTARTTAAPVTPETSADKAATNVEENDAPHLDPPNAPPSDTEEALSNMKQHTYLSRRIKIRSIHNKAWQRLDPPGGGWGLFGLHTVPPGAKEIVLTEGEYDACAVWQATGRPAVSLPNGCRSLPVEVLPLLEDFEKVYLWMDNDAPGQEGAELFARKIGLQRCYLVRPTKANAGDKLPKDANDALLMGLDLERIISDAKLVPHESILTFDELRDDVMHELLHPEKYIGIALPSLPNFTNIIKGLRRGELTVLTGPTGSGKTTFLGQLSLDLAEQDINVLWGSFEIKNTRLMHKLLQQFAREPLPSSGEPGAVERLEAICDRFGSLPLSFMKFHGSSDVEDVLDAMDYATYVNDVQHIILDNMQFMISRQSSNSTFDKFDIQDVAIEKFRKFATDRNVHITLVVHPRKEQEDSKLSMASIYGSAKATQEADTVLILQNEGSRKYVEVKKNRFNGQLGFAPLYFDRKSNRYVEQPLANGNVPTHPSPNSRAKTPSAESHWDKFFSNNQLPPS